MLPLPPYGGELPKVSKRKQGYYYSRYGKLVYWNGTILCCLHNHKYLCVDCGGFTRCQHGLNSYYCRSCIEIRKYERAREVKAQKLQKERMAMQPQMWDYVPSETLLFDRVGDDLGSVRRKRKIYDLSTKKVKYEEKIW